MFRNPRPSLPVRYPVSTGNLRAGGLKRRSRFQPRLATLALLVVGVSLLGVLVIYRLLVTEEAQEEESAWWGQDLKPSAAFCRRVSPPLVCAHGGDTTRAHPNTIKAIRAVPLTGARCVEVDVSRTLDNVLVASHGRDFASVLGLTSANIGDFTSDTVFALDVGENEHIPTLEAAVKAALDSGMALITVDTKPGPPRREEGFADDVLTVLSRVQCGTKCQVCLTLLQVWAKADSIVEDSIVSDPKVQTGYVVMNQTEEARNAGMDRLERIRDSGVVATYYGMIDEQFVKAAHQIHKQVHAWTVNDKDATRKVLEAGVDAIVTNHPRDIQRVVDSLVKMC